MIRVLLVTNPIDPSRDKQVREVECSGDKLDVVLIDSGFVSGELDVWAQGVFVSVNGHVWARSFWSDVTPQDGDSIVIAPLVRGGGVWKTLATLAVIAAAAVAASTGAGAILGGMLIDSLGGVMSVGTATALTSIFAGAVSVAGNLLVSAFLGPSQSANKNDSASYDPDGPRTLAQSGVVIPKGYGTFMWGGNIISSFTEINGADYFFNLLVCFGFGPARSITGIEINGKAISTYQNCAYYTRLGTNDQTEIAQFNQISNGYPQDTQCLAGIPIVVPGTGDLTQQLQVDVQFPDGIFVDTNDGNIIPAVITYQVQYSVAGLNDWQPVLQPQTTAPVIALNPDGSPYLPNSWGVIATDLPAGSNVVYTVDNGPHTPGDKWTGSISVETFEPNGNHSTSSVTRQGEWQQLDINMNYVYVLTWTDGYVDFVAAQTTPCYNRTTILGLAPGKYDVQITKYGTARLHDDVYFGDNWSPNIGQDMWVHSVNEITYLDLAYPNMILIGVRALATSQLSGSNVNVNAVIEHGLRSLDEGLLPAQLGSFEEDNPACVAADMMVDDLYGGGAWPGISAFSLERFIDEWEAWAGNNDTLVPDGNGNSIRMCVFNGVFDNESDLWTQTGVVASMSRACIVPIGTDYGVSLDQAVDAPVQMFTVGNILQDSFTESWLPVDERTNQVEVQFADETRYYREDNPMVYMDQASMDNGTPVKITRIRGKGITVPAQAWHFARYKELGALLQRTGTFRTDTAGVACRPFNVIALQHDVPQWGYGGRTLPGSTASTLNIDRNDVPFVEGTSYTVMVMHPDVLRLTGTVTAVATSTNPPGFTLTIPSWANTARITRAVVNGTDCAVLESTAESIVVSPPPGFTPATGQTVLLYDTDVLETQPVSGVEITGTTAVLTLSSPLSRVPQEYSNYIYGVSGGVKWVRVTSIRKANEQRSTIDYIDYDADGYSIATPTIGETSAIVVTNPGVTSLTGSESFQLIGGTYASFASLAWQNGPDTVGVNIYATIVGGTSLPQLVARLTGNATSWQGQQAANTTVEYTVVGFDVNNVFANFTTAPTVTIAAVGIADNLLLGSSFESGFTYWNLTPRAGDTLTPTFEDDGEAQYTVAGTALTTPTTFAFQLVKPSEWAVGDYLMLSGYVEDSCVSSSAPNVGQAQISLVFLDSSGNTISSTPAAIALNGTQPTLTRINTAAIQIPTGTAGVAVAFGVGGTGLDIPVGSVITYSHLLLEIAAAGQTEPSAWADLDVQGQVLDIFTSGSSTALRVQGSVLPSFTGSITYTSTTTTLTITWTNLVIFWPDGALTQVQNGSMTFTGLTASTVYMAFLYYDMIYGGVAAAVPTTPIGTPAQLSAAYDATADAFCKQDNHVALTPGGLSMETVASGTGGGGGGGHYPTCTLRGTELQTPEGPVSNVELKRRFDAGEQVLLLGRQGPERVRSAEWAPVPYFYRVEVVGFEAFGASESLTLKTREGRHIWCSKLRTGTLVDTTFGFRRVKLTRIDFPGEVLHLELEGPSHEYLAVYPRKSHGRRQNAADGVWTHNMKLENPPGLDDPPDG